MQAANERAGNLQTVDRLAQPLASQPALQRTSDHFVHLEDRVVSRHNPLEWPLHDLAGAALRPRTKPRTVRGTPKP